MFAAVNNRYIFIAKREKIHLNYFSLDVEGKDMEILKSLTVYIWLA